MMIEYLEDTLSPDQKSFFESHFLSCPECLEFFESYRQTVEIAHESAETCHFCHKIPCEVKEKIVAYLIELSKTKKTIY